jgi:uncharacterized protein (TIGR02466 family)
MNKKIETKVEVHCIFPVTVYKTRINPNFNKKQNLIINNYLKKLKKNEGNKLSIDSYVLENKYLKNFKNQLLFFVKDYIFNVMKYQSTIKPYVTQSWFNITNNNEYHHKHSHPNSFISGVFYLNADFNYDKIHTYKPLTKTHSLDPTLQEINYYNSSEWIFSVGTYDLILFPSYLEHRVDFKQGDNTRISLAFNTWLKGDIGDKDKLALLKL